jgi:hypothetical protein
MHDCPADRLFDAVPQSQSSPFTTDRLFAFAHMFLIQKRKDLKRPATHFDIPARPLSGHFTRLPRGVPNARFWFSEFEVVSTQFTQVFCL